MSDVSRETAVVHVVEDDGSLRRALSLLFASVGWKTEAFGSVKDFLDSARPQGPGCLVLDIRLPGASGLELQGQLVRQGIAKPIVFMTGYGDVTMSVRAMKAGAIDFLQKPFREQDMLDAVSAAIERDRHQQAKEDYASELTRRFTHLPVRQQQVMMMVAEGLMNKQIAWNLNISEITVKVHRSSMMKNMGFRNMADLVRMADAISSDVSGKYDLSKE